MKTLSLIYLPYILIFFVLAIASTGVSLDRAIAITGRMTAIITEGN